MKWNNRFNYPRTVRSLEDGIRKYEINNQKLPSVTSVLSATKSQEELASLELWRQRVGAINANKIKKEASSRGSALHAYVEDWLRGRINDSFFESAEQYKTQQNVDEFKTQSKVKLTDLLDRINNEKKIERNRNLALSVAAVSAVAVFGIILTI